MKWIEMCFDDCLDLPSLTQIQGNQECIHMCMGYVILESMIWFDLIWFDLIRHSKSHWKQHSLRRSFILVHCWFASNKYFSIPFPFSLSHFRCWWIERFHYSLFKIQCSSRRNAIKRTIFSPTQSIYNRYSYWYPTSLSLWI